MVKVAATIISGEILGCLVTLTSVGAGALGATTLLMLCPRRLTLRSLVGPDITHAVPIAFVGGITHLLIGSVDWCLLLMLLAGSIPGIILTASLNSRRSCLKKSFVLRLGCSEILGIRLLK